MPATIDIISRDQQVRQSISAPKGAVVLPLDTSSVVRLHEPADSVVSYIRQGDDLLIQQDTGTLQLTQFFVADAQGQTSDLVLGSTLQTATHVTFSQTQAQAAAASTDEAVVLTPQLAALPEALAQTLVDASSEKQAEGQADVPLSALQAEAPVLLADEAPSLSINAPLAGDDVISAAEYGQALEISGTSTGLQKDDVVQVVLNGKNYSTAVEADGSWKVVVLAEDMLAVPAGVANIVATAESASGAVLQDSHSIFVITGGVQVTIDELAGDGLLNAAEAQLPLSVTGSVNNAAEGDEVVVSLLDRQFTSVVGAVVDGIGQWSVDVPADIWQRLTDGDISVTATVTNAGGNSGSATRELTLDTQMPTIAINTLAEDDIVNAVEHGLALEVTGTTTGLKGGEVVHVTLDGQDYSSIVSASGEWSVVVPAGSVVALSDGEQSVVATVESHAGNPASGEHSMVVNTATPTVTVNSPLAGDGIIDATELAQSLEVSGTSTGLDAGSIVNIAIGDHHYTTEVEADGSWFLGLSRLEVSTFEDGLQVVSVSVTNPIGNNAEATDYVVVNSTIGANFVMIDPVAGDDQVNAAEAAGELAITGTTQLAPAGAVVTVNIDGKAYTGYVAADGSWSVPVSADAWAGLADGNVTVTAEVTSAGSSGSATRDVLLDTEAPTLTLNPLAGDDIINAAEQQQALEVSGTTTGLAGGEVVTVALNGKDYTTAVNADGSWELHVGAKDITALADGEYAVMASVSDVAGNPASAERDVSVAASSLPVLTITTPLAGDDVINASEHDQFLTVTGLSTGLAVGTPVTVEVNGKTYIAGVAADGSWSTVVPAADVSALPDGVAAIKASAIDSAGNVANASHEVMVDATAPAVTIDPISGDGVINVEEVAAGVPITGAAEPGTEVVVKVGDNEYTVVATGSGSWSVNVPAQVWESLPDGEVSISATATDSAGNSGSVERSVTLDTTPALALTIDGFTDNSGANQGDVTDSGALTDDVTPTLFGSLSAPLPDGYYLIVHSKTTGDVVNGGNAGVNPGNFQVTGTSWSFTPSTQYPLPNGVSDLEVWIWNPSAADGNFQVATSNAFSINIDSQSDTLPTLSITGPLAGDDMINAVEHGQSLDISGTSTGIDEGDVVKVTLNGKQYAAVVSADGSWTLGVTAADIGALPEGNVVITASDADGLVDTQHTVEVDTAPPSKTANITRIDDDTGAAGDFITSDTTPVIYGGTGGVPYPNMRVEISLDGGKTWQGKIQPSAPTGSWQYAVEQELADGEYVVMSRLVDLAGNWSEPDSQTLIIDSTAPTASVTVDSISEDSGSSATDFLTNDTSPTLHGSLSEVLADGEKLQVSVDGGVTWNAAAVNGTDWSYADGRVLADGNHAYQTRLIDAAGNISAGVSQTITIDTAGPSKVANITRISDDTGLPGDYVTSDTTPVIYGGTGGVPYSNMRVEVSLDGGKTWQGDIKPSQSTGSWHYAVEQQLADGEYEVMARLVDPAGNWSRPDTITMIIDTIAPTIAINALSGDDIINAAEHGQALIVSGTTTGLSGGESVEVSLNNGKTYITDVANDGNWSLSVPAADISTLTDGGYTVVAMVMDQAGNPTSVTREISVEAASDSVPLSIDASSPNLLATTYSPQDADHAVVGTANDDQLESTQANDHFIIGNGGNDTLTYRLLDATDATGGNGANHINGFIVGKAETTADADRIDLSELLADSGYQNAADGEVDARALTDYLNVTVKGSDTEIAIDRDGAGAAHEMTTLATLSGVQTDLATLLANHQLIVS